MEIKNIGAIDADGVSGDEIKVTAEKSGPRASEVKIEVVPHGGGVTICAVYPAGMFEGSPDRCAPGNRTYSSNVRDDQTQVHFIVHLPKNLRFSGQTVNGKWVGLSSRPDN